MKCWSRSTLGVIIGILNIVIYFGLVIVIIASMEDIKKYLNNINVDGGTTNPEFNTFLLSSILAVSLGMAAISSLMIYGIVKRHNKFIIPWLIFSAIGCVCDCGRVLIKIILDMVNDFPISVILRSFFLGILGIGFQALIIWPIYTLWRDIRRKNEAQPGFIVRSVRYENNEPLKS